MVQESYHPSPTETHEGDEKIGRAEIPTHGVCEMDNGGMCETGSAVCGKKNLGPEEAAQMILKNCERLQRSGLISARADPEIYSRTQAQPEWVADRVVHTRNCLHDHHRSEENLQESIALEFPDRVLLSPTLIPGHVPMTLRECEGLLTPSAVAAMTKRDKSNNCSTNLQMNDDNSHTNDDNSHTNDDNSRDFTRMSSSNLSIMPSHTHTPSKSDGIILIDMDNTLVDWDSQFSRLMKRYHPSVSLKDPCQRTQYSIELNYDEEARQKILQLTSFPDFWRTMEAAEGALTALKQMVERNLTIYIVTAPDMQYTARCAREKVDWIERWLGPQWKERVILCWDKTLIRGDILIDDKPTAALGCISPPEWTHVLYCQPYNIGVSSKVPTLCHWDNWATVILPVLSDRRKKK